MTIKGSAAWTGVKENPGVCYGLHATSCFALVGSPIGSLIVRRLQRTTSSVHPMLAENIETLFCLKVKKILLFCDSLRERTLAAELSIAFSSDRMIVVLANCLSKSTTG
jgi:hypothetical protein